MKDPQDLKDFYDTQVKEGLPGKVYTVSLTREWLTDPDFIAERTKVPPIFL